MTGATQADAALGALASGPPLPSYLIPRRVLDDLGLTGVRLTVGSIAAVRLPRPGGGTAVGEVLLDLRALVEGMGFGKTKSKPKGEVNAVIKKYDMSMETWLATGDDSTPSKEGVELMSPKVNVEDSLVPRRFISKQGFEFLIKIVSEWVPRLQPWFTHWKALARTLYSTSRRSTTTPTTTPSTPENTSRNRSTSTTRCEPPSPLLLGAPEKDETMSLSKRKRPRHSSSTSTPPSPNTGASNTPIAMPATATPIDQRHEDEEMKDADADASIPVVSIPVAALPSPAVNGDAPPSYCAAISSASAPIVLPPELRHFPAPNVVLRQALPPAAQALLPYALPRAFGTLTQEAVRQTAGLTDLLRTQRDMISALIGDHEAVAVSAAAQALKRDSDDSVDATPAKRTRRSLALSASPQYLRSGPRLVPLAPTALVVHFTMDALAVTADEDDGGES